MYIFKVLMMTNFMSILLSQSIHSSKSFVKIGISKTTARNDSIENNNTTNGNNKSETSSTTATTLSTVLPTTSTSTSSPATTFKSTTVISTTIPSTTATSKLPNKTQSGNSSSNVIPKLEAIFRQPSSHLFCECDLSMHFCEPNCCCDIDCTEEVLKVFRCYEEHHTLYDFQYNQGLPYCKVNDGWLCIFKDNANLRMNSIFNPDQKKKYYTWPDPFTSNTEIQNSGDFYRYGDQIFIYNGEADTADTFDIPYSLLNPRCQVYEPIRFLMNNHQECLATLEKAQDFTKLFINNINNIKLFKQYKNVRNKAIMPEHCWEKNIDCVPFVKKVCVQNASDKIIHCDQFKNNTLDELVEEMYCGKVTIDIHHNYTFLLAGEIRLHFENIENIENTIWQQFEVNFLHINGSNETEVVYNSGNIGYIDGKPLIKGRYVLVNETAEENEKKLILDYFHPNRIKYKNEQYFRIPGSKDGGTCSQMWSETINFGESSFSKCYINISNTTNILAVTNFTKTCNDLQNKAFQFLLNQSNNTFSYDLSVSEFGTPRNRTNNWIKIITKNNEISNILGFYSLQTNSFSCQNMVINVKYKFLIGRVSVDGIPHQNLIKQAFLEYGTPLDLQFQLDEEIKIPIYIDVMFFDYTQFSSTSGCFEKTISYKLVIIMLMYKYF